MARFQRVLPMVDFQEKSFAKVYDFLTGKKFKYETVDGQQVFRKGDGFWAAAKFIRVCYADNHVLLEAWVDAQGAEMDLEGPVACAAKKTLEKIVVGVQEILTQPGDGYVPAESTAHFRCFRMTDLCCLRGSPRENTSKTMPAIITSGSCSIRQSGDISAQG